MTASNSYEICLIIALIIFLLAVSFKKSKKTKWTISALPLGLLPLAHGLAGFITRILKINYGGMALIAVICVSAAISCALCGMCAVGMVRRRISRLTYITASIVFNLALAGTLLYNLRDLL